MDRASLPMLVLAALVALAGCSGFFGTSPPPESTPHTKSTSAAESTSPTESTFPGTSSSSGAALQELENASMWVGGTVAGVENATLSIETSEYNDAVIAVSLREGALFRCQSNSSGCQPVERREVQHGQQVCAFVRIETGTVVASKVFFNAVCTWQQSDRSD